MRRAGCSNKLEMITSRRIVSRCLDTIMLLFIVNGLVVVQVLWALFSLAAARQADDT